MKKNKVVADGYIDLWVDGAITPDKSLIFSEEQINAYWFLIEQQEKIKQSIIQGLKNEFPNLLASDYGSWDWEDPNFPKNEDMNPAFDFKDYIGSESISILKDIKNESAYVQWHFNCRWDIEHGFDVVTHNERIIEIAAAADPWKIYKDNNTLEQIQKEYNNKVWELPKKKKWWQFWV